MRPFFSVSKVYLVALHVRGTFGAEDVVGDICAGLVELAAGTESFHAVFPFVNGIEVVVDIAVFRIDACDASAGCGDFYGILVAHDPAEFVKAVDVLLVDVIAGQPIEVEPVAHLVFDLSPGFGTTLVPERTGIVRGLHVDDIANLAVVNALDEVLLCELISVAEPRDDVDVFLRRYLAGFHH